MFSKAMGFSFLLTSVTFSPPMPSKLESLTPLFKQYQNILCVFFASLSFCTHCTLVCPIYIYMYVPTVPVFIRLMMVLSRKIVENLPFPQHFPPGDRWSDVLGCVPAGSVSSPSTHKARLKCKPLVMATFSSSLSARLFPLTPAYLRQYIHRRFWRWISNIDTYAS